MRALPALFAPALFAAIGCVDVSAPDAPVQSASVYDASKRFDISPYDLQDRTARGRRGGPRGKAAHDLVEALYDWSRGKGSGDLSSRPDDFTPSLYEPMMECLNSPCEEPAPWMLFTWIQEGTVRYLVGGAQVHGGWAIVPVWSSEDGPATRESSKGEFLLEWSGGRWRVDNIGERFVFEQRGGKIYPKQIGRSNLRDDIELCQSWYDGDTCLFGSSSRHPPDMGDDDRR